MHKTSSSFGPLRSSASSVSSLTLVRQASPRRTRHCPQTAQLRTQTRLSPRRTLLRRADSARPTSLSRRTRACSRTRSSSICSLQLRYHSVECFAFCLSRFGCGRSPHLLSTDAAACAARVLAQPHSCIILLVRTSPDFVLARAARPVRTSLLTIYDLTVRRCVPHTIVSVMSHIVSRERPHIELRLRLTLDRCTLSTSHLLVRYRCLASFVSAVPRVGSLLSLRSSVFRDDSRRSRRTTLFISDSLSSYYFTLFRLTCYSLHSPYPSSPAQTGYLPQKSTNESKTSCLRNQGLCSKQCRLRTV